MNHRNRPINTLQRAQDRQHDGMVTAQTDDTWVSPFVRRVGWMVQDLAVSLLHLLEGMRCVEGCDGDVAAVDDTQSFFEGVHVPDGVVATSFLFA